MEVLHVSTWSESLGDIQDPVQYFCYLSCLQLSTDLKYLLWIILFSSLISFPCSLPSLLISRLERGWHLSTLMGYQKGFVKAMEYNFQKLVSWWSICTRNCQGAFGLPRPKLDLPSALKAKSGHFVIILWSTRMRWSLSSQITRFYMEIFTIHGCVVFNCHQNTDFIFIG